MISVPANCEVERHQEKYDLELHSTHRVAVGSDETPLTPITYHPHRGWFEVAPPGGAMSGEGPIGAVNSPRFVVTSAVQVELFLLTVVLFPMPDVLPHLGIIQADCAQHSSLSTKYRTPWHSRAFSRTPYGLEPPTSLSTALSCTPHCVILSP